MNIICGWNASFNIYGDCKSALSLREVVGVLDICACGRQSYATYWRLSRELRDGCDTPKWNLRHMPGQYLVADGLTKPFSRPRIPKLVDATITINVEETPKVLKAHSGYTIQREVEG